MPSVVLLPTHRIACSNTPPYATAGAALVDLAEAEKFLRLYFAENPGDGSFMRRWAAVRREAAQTGTYTHTPEELAFGARVAWRNARRCIGRLYWRSLQVRDHRDASTAINVFDALVDHLREATNGGRIRPMITFLAPAGPGSPGVRIWNEQLIRYAGWRQADGSVVGDPRTVGFTEMVRQLGWQGGTGSAHDVLPIVIQMPGAEPKLFDLPPDAILEVTLEHPRYPWFAELGLRWHAVPAISCMRLEIGGVSYGAAPFNGWYMGTEIGARDLADWDRYDLVPEVARRLGLDTSTNRSLWRDRALVELNIAVLYSFAKAGVTITDHHTESERFLIHLTKEERAGRITPADWTWIVPPMSASQTPVFHRYYDDVELSPGFHLDDDAAARASGDVPITGSGRSVRPGNR